MLLAMPTLIGVIIPRDLRDELFHQRDIDRLNALGDVRYTEGVAKNSVDLDDAVKVLHDAEIAIGSWGTPHPGKGDLLARCPKLKLWLHVAGSVKGMFGPHLEGRDLTIASIKGAIADNVAEMVLGEIILGLRRVWQNARDNRKGKAGSPEGLKVLYGSTVGVVAASEVGRRVIKLLEPFDCRVLLFDPVVSEDKVRAMGVERFTDLTLMCRECDAVTLHTPDLPATHKLMRAEQFRAMPDGCVFINTSRGECVDEAALITELEKGRLFAFLDVSDPEPAMNDSPLRRLDNVVYTSHIAGPPGRNMGQKAVDDVEHYLRGEPLDCVVTAGMLEYVA